MPKPKPLSRAARAAESRDAIVETAARLFLRSGIEATSLDAVAAELGLTKGAVYGKFPSKGALVEAVATTRSTTERIFDALLEPGQPLATRLARFSEQVVKSDVRRSTVLLDLEYVIYSARNGLWEKTGRARTEAKLGRLAARFREVNAGTGDRLAMPEEKFLLLLNILARGLVQELALHPGSITVADVTRMMGQLAPAPSPSGRRAGRKLKTARAGR
jgi:AcrR family transcriptional regulator